MMKEFIKADIKKFGSNVTIELLSDNGNIDLGVFSKANQEQILYELRKIVFELEDILGVSSNE